MADELVLSEEVGQKLTFAETEELLAEIVDTLDELPADQAEGMKSVVAIALKGAVEKRERTAQYILDEQDRIAMGRKRLKDGKAFLDSREKKLDKFTEYLAAVIKGFGTDAKGKYPVLKGITSQLSLRKCPDTVKLIDEAAVPAKFKTLTITVAAEDWWAHVAWCRERKQMENLQNVGAFGYDVEDETVETLEPVRVTGIDIDKAAIKKAIEAGGDVPGADLAFGEYNLSVK